MSGHRSPATRRRGPSGSIPDRQTGRGRKSHGPSVDHRLPTRLSCRPARLLPVVALLFPGVAAHVVAVVLPEAGLILGQKLEAAQPLGALPEIKVRHEQPQRPAMIWGDVLAVPPKRQQDIVTVQV